ncbi:hypothetical protein [Lactococcus kimchii]|uniref:hypothetical protein n=1 Tax=Lactococcus sp. S-13 TaxID=2507158 RepID=UPI0010237905|nr:hypothetical protein [Lactococcus sp. S-13]RZI47838.1 hypothetical protein EQJ87_11220 [Lactococcus sp. S-13]
MAYGDYWKAVSPTDYDLIQEWIINHDAEDGVDTEAIDVAFLLFGDKYGEDIKLVEHHEVEVLRDGETGEEYYLDESRKPVYGNWGVETFESYRYLDTDFTDSTIEYIPVANESIISIANDLAQNSWRFAFDLKPKEGVETLEEYQEQLDECGY